METVVLIILAGFLNAVMDVLNFHYSTSIFKRWNPNFWNPEVSWRNKWKNGDKEQGPKFIGSSTVFSLFTDGWHLAQSGFLFSMVGAIVFYKPVFGQVLDFVLLSICFRVFFECFYELMRD